VARGVSKDFINLLFDDTMSARGRVIVASILLGALLGIATWLWWPIGAAVHIGAALIGFLGGWLIAAGSAGRYETSLRDQWNEWMRVAPACDTVADAGRKVAGKRVASRAYLIAAVLTLLWATELTLVALAFNGSKDVIMQATIIAANGIFAGGLLGHQVRLMTWTRAFARSLAEMMRDGEIGVWGVR
jgi:hypothetical protein